MLRRHADLIEARNDADRLHELTATAAVRRDETPARAIAGRTAIREVPKLPPRLLANARILPDRDAILPLLPKGKVCVEVGVALGEFSEKMIRICEPSHFIAIDSFRIHEYETLWGRPTSEVFRGQTHEAFYRQRFADLIGRGQVKVLSGDSAQVLGRLPDKSLDIVYVDADHVYEAVRRELSIIRHKIRDDGIIILNDYTMVDVVGSMEAYGVIQAAHEFMLAEDWEMIYLALQNYMYCDVALRKSRTASP